MTEPVSEQVAALRRELKLTWDSHEREHVQHEQAHGREHQFAQDAIDKAAELAKENKAASNEWRAAMNDRETRFATKEDVKAILFRLDNIERAALVANERDRIRAVDDAEDKRQTERRQSRAQWTVCLLYTSPSPRDGLLSRMPSSA